MNAGVLAFGDSITNGGGELQWGVALQSWALWTARGLGLPYTGHAVDGARARGVVDEQIPAFERRTALPGARYDVGCLYIGVNDVRAEDWDPRRFAADHATARDFLRARCDRVLLVTLPRDLGRPRARGVDEANEIILGAGETTLDLRDFGARNLVMTDHVHPTAFGQVWIAERALQALRMDVKAWPSTLIAPHEGSPLRRLQGDWTYVYRTLKRLSGDSARRAARAAAARSGSPGTAAARTPVGP